MVNIDIDIDIDIDMYFLENIDIVVHINKGFLQNIDIDKILYRLEFGISNRAIWNRLRLQIAIGTFFWHPVYLGAAVIEV